jgi:hypothetical protein
MKLTVTVHIAEDEFRVYTVLCGDGDKTFKWLVSAVSSRYAEESCAQFQASGITLNGTAIEDPMGLVSSLSNGDEVVVALQRDFEVDAAGIPILSEWSKRAYVAGYVAPAGVVPGSLRSSESKGAMRSKVEFVRATMLPQLLNWTIIGHEVHTLWPTVMAFLSKISYDDELELKEITSKNFLVIQEMYHEFSSKGHMSVSEFINLIEATAIFRKDSIEISKDTYEFISKSQVTETFGLASFIAALLIISKVRYNDTFENGQLHRISLGYQQVIHKGIRPLAVVKDSMERNCFKSLFREVFSSEKFLAKLSPLRKDLLAVFEKEQRMDCLLLEMPMLQRILNDSKLVLETKGLLQIIENGCIYGRVISPDSESKLVRDDSDLEQIVEDSLVFPEFVEALCRAAYESSSARRDMDAGVRAAIDDALRHRGKGEEVDVWAVFETGLVDVFEEVLKKVIVATIRPPLEGGPRTNNAQRGAAGGQRTKPATSESK